MKNVICVHAYIENSTFLAVFVVWYKSEFGINNLCHELVLLARIVKCFPTKYLPRTNDAVIEFIDDSLH